MQECTVGTPGILPKILSYAAQKRLVLYGETVFSGLTGKRKHFERIRQRGSDAVKTYPQGYSQVIHKLSTGENRRKACNAGRLRQLSTENHLLYVSS